MRYPESVYSRREFLDAYIAGLGACIAGFALYPVAKFVLPWKIEKEPDKIVMKEPPELAPGEGFTFFYGPSPAILFRMKEGKQELRAFNAICTHFDCTVQYLEGEGKIHCACHDGWYNLDGDVTAGPPPRPLKRYDVAMTDEGLVIAQPGLLEEEAKTDAETA
jgi:Rieske Fe-S protein